MGLQLCKKTHFTRSATQFACMNSIIGPQIAVVCSFFATILLTSCVQNDDAFKAINRDPREVPFVTTPQIAVNRMLALCRPSQEDIVLDLGCGDGRIVITAAKQFGCKGIGYDIDPKLIKLCKENAKRAGVEDLVEFYQQDIFDADLPKDATIVTMYLYPQMNLRLLPYLQSLAPGKHVVSFRWEMPGVKETKVEKFETGEKMLPMANIYYFETPLLVDPDWTPEPKSPEEVDFDKIKDKLKYTPKK